MQFKVITSLGRIQKEAEAVISDFVFCGLLFLASLAPVAHCSFALLCISFVHG